ncbi:hypothetical protein [Agrobacterium sp. AGB01]|nr:hypothetical protein [Agrobacterium sp. AGB01]
MFHPLPDLSKRDLRTIREMQTIVGLSFAAIVAVTAVFFGGF